MLTFNHMRIPQDTATLQTRSDGAMQHNEYMCYQILGSEESNGTGSCKWALTRMASNRDHAIVSLVFAGLV